MSHRFLAKFAPLFAGLALATVAVPLAAQNFSDGYLLLKAVRESDGTKATELLSRPGSTLANARDQSSGETGLHIAAKRQDATWVRFLLQNGANPNVADNRGITPLIVAARAGDAESATALLDGGARVDDIDATGQTPLIVATHLGNLALIDALLSHGADADRADNSGRTARDYAKLDGNRRVLEVFATQDAKNAAKADTYGPSL